MGQLSGNSVELVVGFETSFGVPGADGFKVPFAPTLDASTDQAINKSTVITGDASPTEPFLGFKDGKVSGTFPLDDKAFPVFLKGLFGAPTTTGADPYVHTFKIPKTLPSMFFEVNHTDGAGGLFYNTVGVGLNSFSVSLGGDGELLVSIEGIAKDTAKDTTTVITGSTTDLTDGIRFSQFQAAITGITNKISAFDISFSNEIDSNTYVIDGTGSRGGIPKGIANINGSLEALFEDDTLYAKTRAFDTVSLTATLTSGASIIEFAMQETKLNAKTNTTIDSPIGLKASLTYEAFFKIGANATALQIAVTNAHATIGA